MPDATVRGRFVWHELLTTDTTSAADFYNKVVGWKTRPWEEDSSYVMFLAGKVPMGGMMAINDEMKAMGVPPNWGTYIGTPDVDQTARQAESLGGTIRRPPADIPTIGRFAVLQDPQGAVFMAFTPLPPSQPQQQPPPAGVPVVGDFSWHELATTDWRAALRFYRQLFGWEEAGSMEMGQEMGTYQMFGAQGRPVGGMFNKPPHMQGPSFWLPYIKVADSKKVAAIVPGLGGQIINGPMEVPGGDWITQGIDLQGAFFAVHSAKPAARPAAARKKPAPAKKASKSAARAASPSRKTKKAPAKKAKRPAIKRTAKAAKSKTARRAKAPARKVSRTATRKKTPSRKKTATRKKAATRKKR